MPSVFSRLLSLFPGFTPRATPEQRTSLVRRTREELENTPRRRFASTEERVPSHFHGGVAGKVWFLPYADSTTEDTPDIRAAMRLMRRDPYVKAAWEPQILTVASEDWQIAASEEGNPDAEEQAEFVQRMFEDYTSGGMPQVVRAVASPWGSEGHGIAEPVWGVARQGRLEGKVVLEALKAKDSDRTIRLEGDQFNNVRWVSSLTRNERYPIEDFVYTRYMTVFDEPLGQAAFRPAYGDYWMRDTVRKLRMIHCEKKMAGMLVGTYAADDDRGPLESALAKAKTSTWMAIPEGSRVECLQISTASEPDYKSYDESLRDSIVTGIAFATLQILMGSVPDARGDSKVQKAIFDLAPWLVMTLVTDAVNQQLIPKAIDYNFPFPAAGGYPKLTFGAVSNQELLEQIQIVEGAQRLGFDNLSKKHYTKTLSLKLADPNDPDDVLAPAGQGGMGGMFGGMGGMPPPGGGFGGGVGAALPPGMPPDAGGAMPFADSDPYWEFREPTEWRPHPKKSGYMISKGGRVLSDAAYAKFKKRAAKTPVPGTTSPANAPTPQQPFGPAPVWIPGAPAKPATTPTGTVPGKAGRLRRAYDAAKKHAKGAVKKYVPTSAADAGLKQARATRDAAIKLRAIGRKLKRFKWLEKTFGMGRMMEKMGARARRRAVVVMNAYKVGSKAGAKAAAREMSRAAGVHWKESRRKYGVLGAVALEATAFVLNWVVKPVAMAVAVPIPGVKQIVSMMLSPILRGIAEYPFRVATRGLNAHTRTALPMGQYSEEGDPLDMVITLRQILDDYRAAVGEPLTGATDAELADVLEQVLSQVGGMVDDAVAGAEERFAEEYESFGGWDDWKQMGGGKWKSPGGRVLSDAVYQRLKNSRSGRVAADATPSGVAEVPPGEIGVDPERFQFKLRTDAATGTGAELKSVDHYNPELAGVLAVWKDPASGKTFVVNGHHRLELARRANAPGVLVRHLKAANAQEARAKGALINIAEGRGTAVDAAKFLRDTGTTAADLQKVGISLQGSVARDAATLARLDGGLFHRVTLGVIDVPRALAVANHLPDHGDQRMLMQHIDRLETKTARPVPPAVVAEMAREMAATPRAKVGADDGGLFAGIGGDEEESLFLHRADIKSFVRQELAARARNFGMLGSKRRAAVVTSGAGNVVDPARNRAVAEESKNLLADFERDANRAGPVFDAINQAAAEYASARTPTEQARVKQRAAEAVRNALSPALF